LIEYKFELPFPVPKKNSRVTNRKTGRSFPNKRYTAWHKLATNVLQFCTTPLEPIQACLIKIEFYAPDKRKRDLTNFAESINDLLADNGIIEDDNWYIVPIVHLYYRGVNKENPSAIVTLELLD